MNTYWVEPVVGANTRTSGAGSTAFSDADGSEKDAIDTLLALHKTKHSAMTERLIDFNTGALEQLIRKVLAHRQACGQSDVPNGAAEWKPSPSATVRQEVVDTVALPAFRKIVGTVDPSSIILEPQVVQQLRSYVAEIAHTYNDNHFHNFGESGFIVVLGTP